VGAKQRSLCITKCTILHDCSLWCTIHQAQLPNAIFDGKHEVLEAMANTKCLKRHCRPCAARVHTKSTSWCPGTDTNRTRLALLGMQSRTLGPYLAAIHTILIPVLLLLVSWRCKRPSMPRHQMPEFAELVAGTKRGKAEPMQGYWQRRGASMTERVRPHARSAHACAVRVNADPTGPGSYLRSPKRVLMSYCPCQ
jgi:hypothetical protein